MSTFNQQEMYESEHFINIKIYRMLIAILFVIIETENNPNVHQ